MRPTPAGRGGTARCCSPYNAILERLDTMDVRIQQAVDDANAAMSAAVIQAGNAAQSASDALTQAGIAAGKASDAAADAADAAQDAADAAQALSDINDTIQTTLDNELGGKVDKLTTAGLHLYSHTGSTQSEEEPIDGTTANSIPIRDGNGRMQAADPASGATDKTLVTANWVSQTGDSAPNNLVHKSGNETKTGWLNLKTGADGIRYQHAVNTDNTADDKWRLALTLTMQINEMLIVDIVSGFNNPDTQDATIKIVRSGPNLIRCQVIRTAGTTAQMASASNYVATLDGNTVSLYIFKRRRYTNLFALTVFYGEYGYVKQIPNITYNNTASNDPTGETHDAIGVGSLTAYHDQA